MRRTASSCPVICGLLIATLLWGCFGTATTTRHWAHQNYRLHGTIFDVHGGALNCRLACLSDHGLIMHGAPDPRTGQYSITLSSEQTQALHRLRIVDALGDTSHFQFDHELLRDSIIHMDMMLKYIPRNYIVLIQSSAHEPYSGVIDTIWLDLNGKRVSKAISDSLWRDIPHR